MSNKIYDRIENMLDNSVSLRSVGKEAVDLKVPSVSEIKEEYRSRSKSIKDIAREMKDIQTE